MLLKNIFSTHTNIVPSGTVNIRCPHCGQRGQMSVFHAQRDAAVYGLRFLRRDGRRILICPSCAGVFTLKTFKKTHLSKTPDRVR
ncbi:hypothetical protein [Anaerotruncus colihominis]|uniref:hypothetical protein n=1 Tax=Anaerotruncus colihominis TaxID=169435 RepID=UPI00242C9B1F|nr:hypothetical protein [Anaerotruncus colihominis]